MKSHGATLPRLHHFIYTSVLSIIYLTAMGCMLHGAGEILYLYNAEAMHIVHPPLPPPPPQIQSLAKI